MLDLEGFIRLLDASRLTNDLIEFFKGNEAELPNLSQLINQAYYTKEIIKSVESVLDNRMQVKDSASAEFAAHSAIYSKYKKRHSQELRKGDAQADP